MIDQLIKLSNHLDKNGYIKEANYLDGVIKKHAFRNPFERSRARGNSIREAVKRANLEINIIVGALNDWKDDLKTNRNCKSYDKIMNVRAAINPEGADPFVYQPCEGGELHHTQPPDVPAAEDDGAGTPEDTVRLSPPSGPSPGGE